MNNKTKFPKPNLILYHLIAFFVRIFLWIKFKPKYNLDEIRHIKGPAVIMCSHTSNLDFLLVAVGLLPLRPTYIMSNHFFVHPKIGPLLKPLHAIPKKMFCADVNAVRQIMKAIRAGNQVIMFPEGRLSCCGHGLPIAEGTAELLKKLGVDVYWLEEHGLYKALPKWGKTGIRKGPVHIDGGLLMKGEELASLSVDEINSNLYEAVYHNDEKSFVGETYKSEAPALGLHEILYKCPICGEEFKMSSYDDTLKCESCGTEWTLDQQYVLHGDKFNSINAWFDWEQSVVDIDKPIECDCLLGTPDENGVMNHEAGSGHFKVDQDEITYEGTLWGEPFSFIEKTSAIKAFPVTVGKHIDMYSNKVLYYITPVKDRNLTTKYVQFMDRL